MFLPFLSILFIGFVIVNNADDNHSLLGVYFIYKDMERTDIYFVEDDTYFNNNVEGVEIHAECLSQDFDDIAWEPIVDDSPIVDPENDVFGYYD
nr:MAG: hypothetical protein [Bacteriophage sp.]